MSRCAHGSLRAAPAEGVEAQESGVRRQSAGIAVVTPASRMEEVLT